MQLPSYSWYSIVFFTSVVAAWKIPKEYAISPSPDGHFLQDSTGKPFFWQADTAWTLWHHLNYSEVEKYLSDRAAKGYTIVLASGLNNYGLNDKNRFGETNFVNGDLTKPNEKYWKYADDVVELAWSKGIRIGMVPSWGKYVHSDTNVGDVINATTAYAFGKFIGQRYPYLPKTLVGDTNPWWMNKTAVKADYAYGGVAPVCEHTDWSPIYDLQATGIIAGERAATNSSTWKPLLTMHATNQWFNGGPIALASAFFGDRDWLTLDTSQSGHSDIPPNPPIPWWNCRRGWETIELMYAVGETKEGKKRPAIDNEPHYENRYNNGKPANIAYWNASDVRIGAWQAAFSGAAGITYGADAIWQFGIPGLYNSTASGPDSWWEDAIKLPGSGQMQHIKNACLDRGDETYFQRVPAQDIIVGDAGINDQRVTATRDVKGSWIMVYTPTGKEFTIKTDSLVGGNVTARWFDPVDGTYSATTYSSSGGQSSFTPANVTTHVDWVLVLEAGQ